MSAILPLVIAPSIAPIVKIEPNVENCHLIKIILVAILMKEIMINYWKREKRNRKLTSAKDR